MPQVYPEKVEMTAQSRNRTSTNALARVGDLGRFVVNTVERTLAFDLSEQLAGRRVAIHGFVPRGWKTDPLIQLERGQRHGVWNYQAEQERNILDGLAYISFQSDGANAPDITAQIEPKFPEVRKFEDFVTITPMAGQCNGRMTLFGQFEDVEMALEPAQVIIARSAAITLPDGRRQQEIGCAIRVGGAHVEGLGRIEIGMFGDKNPGTVTSMAPGSDFPARMTFEVRKSYITPAGSFYRDSEEFAADGLTRFPPFGVKFHPSEEIAPLRNARSGNIVGQIRLGWLVPLCHIDLGASGFPSKAIANARFEQESD